MPIISIWVRGDRTAIYRVTREEIDFCLRQPRTFDRFAYWRKVTGDPRIVGHVMIWSIIDP